MFWFDISGPKSYPFCPKLAQNAPLFAGLDRPANGTQKGPLSRYFVYDMVTIEQIESAPPVQVAGVQTGVAAGPVGAVCHSPPGLQPLHTTHRTTQSSGKYICHISCLTLVNPNHEVMASL